MKAVRLFFVIILSITACGQVAQEKERASDVPQPQAAPTPASFLSAFKKTVAFITTTFEYTDSRGGKTSGQASGTGFFVVYPEPKLGPDRGFCYFVTNRHVVQPSVNGTGVRVTAYSLRLNLKRETNGVFSSQGQFQLSDRFHWYFPSDDSVDLAVFPVLPDESTYDYERISTTMFATPEVIQKEKIVEGIPLLFAGYFYQFPGQKRAYPIVRQGLLAMMPEEELITTLNKPGHIYLADVHTFGGNSGSPVFANTYAVWNPSVGGKIFFLGVVSGYFYETEDFTLQIATTLQGKAAANSGVSIIVPANNVLQLLQSPELNAQRDYEIAHLSK
jgi:hypothetical protein